MSDDEAGKRAEIKSGNIRHERRQHLGAHLNLLSAYSVFPNRCPFRKKHQAKTCKGSKNRQSDLTKISGRAFWVNDYTAHFTGFFNIQCS